MFILLCVVSLILVFIISVLLDYSTKIDDENKDFFDKFYRSDITDKIDELIERMGKHKPNRIILGSYFWKQIPTTYTIKWKKSPNPEGGLRPKVQDTIMYKDVEIVHDKENEYTFDLE